MPDTVLTAAKVGDRHEYLASARPDWRMTAGQLDALGGPWWCPSCETASLLMYRCSVCGTDLTEKGERRDR